VGVLCPYPLKSGLSLLLAPNGDHHVGAGSSQRGSGGETQAGVGAGDHRHSSGLVGDVVLGPACSHGGFLF
jgi:hypothetical protein